MFRPARKETILFTLSLLSPLLLPLHGEDAPAIAPLKSLVEEGYTINYNTVSMIEYLRFASKICGANFIFNEADLPFTVTVISDEPITPENVMSTLVQILRIHGLSLLEQDNNLVIHTSNNVKQLATLVTESGQNSKAPIVTRIFRLKNAKVDSVAAIIRPMISQEAMMETSPETRQLILTDTAASVDKVATLIENLDSPHNPLDIRIFQAQYNTPEILITIASQIMSPLAQGNPFILVPQILANQVFIVSTPELTERAYAILMSLDVAPKQPLFTGAGQVENIFVYHPLQRSGIEILAGLQTVVQSLRESGFSESALINSIDHTKWLAEAQSLIFLGTPETIVKLKELMSALDTPIAKGTLIPEAIPPNDQFLLYKIKQPNPLLLESSLKKFANGLDQSKSADQDLLATLRSMKYIEESNAFLFIGSPNALRRLQEVLPTFDSATAASAAANISLSNQFYIYKPVNVKGDQILYALKDITAQLKSNELADPAFLDTIQSAKWIKSTNAILFTGDSDSIARIQDLLTTIDTIGTRIGAVAGQTFLIYHLQYASRTEAENYLKQVSDRLNKKESAELIHTIRSAEWVAPSQSFMFYGSEPTLTKIQDLLTQFDIAEVQKPSLQPSQFFLYAPQYVSQEKIDLYLDQVTHNLIQKQGDDNLIRAIQSKHWVEESRSFMFTGSSASLDQIKALLTSFDVVNFAEKKSTKPTYFLYKLQYVPGTIIEEDLDLLAKNFRASGLQDPQVLDVIEHIRYVKETNSLLLTGNPEAVEEVKALIAQYDVPRGESAITSFGASTFLLYKLKQASGAQVLSSLQAISNDLKKSGASDPGFLAALQTAKYITETNAILFIGPAEALEKVQILVEKFDVPSLAAPSAAMLLQEQMATVNAANAGQFFMYQPQTVPGASLQGLMLDFAQNLKLSGLQDTDFFQAMASMRWIEASHSLIFTGTPQALARIKELLISFDIPSNVPAGAEESLDSAVQLTDTTSFLVYKLQFHKGDEIQGALRQIAKDLTAVNLANAAMPATAAAAAPPVNQNLLNAVNSLQWLEVTNSLLCTGDPETLTRLKELIKNLDVPLKQVFVEMLVITTTLANALDFGLEWGSKYNYRNKFSGSMGNFVDSSDTFATNLSAIDPSNTPLPSDIPFFNSSSSSSSNFSLGVIGEVIKHNGNTFLSLGSLLNALQSESETTVVLTPKLILQDGKTSTLFVGSNIPFVGSFVDNNGASTVQTSNLEYRNVGFSLTITPVLGNSDVVTLDVSLDTSSVIGSTSSTIDFSSSSATGVSTSLASMQTTVHVLDNNFLILSGMIDNSHTKEKIGMPCLGSLPLIGAAFSENNTNDTFSNLVIFLRPHILNSIDDIRRLTRGQEEFFRDQAPTPYLLHNFEEGMELIKTVDDE